MDQLPYDLNGRVALITDANHGIGAAAETLASCGAAVLVAIQQRGDRPARDRHRYLAGNAGTGTPESRGSRRGTRIDPG